MKIITIIGARPQFIKAAMLSHAIRHRAQSGQDIQEYILHTGQHYDFEMSEIFFNELHLPQPTWNIGCTDLPERMQQHIVPVLKQQQPDLVVVFGDTNSTLAGALAAHACHIPLAHIEAGLRSYNAQMVEEHNRIETDRLSQWLFCPTRVAVANLRKEGITHGVYHVGDIMYDAALHVSASPAAASLPVAAPFALVTVHRAENTDSPQRMHALVQALTEVPMAVVWPIHPRTRKVVEADAELQQLLCQAPHIHVIDSVGYSQMAQLEQQACFILTDSGGVQKESYFHRTPCITLREETEWPETIDAGWNTLAGTDPRRIQQAIQNLHNGSTEIDDFGDGNTANHILDILCASF